MKHDRQQLYDNSPLYLSSDKLTLNVNALTSPVLLSIFLSKKGFEALQPELSFLGDYESMLSFYDIADITDAYKCTGKYEIGSAV